VSLFYPCSEKGQVFIHGVDATHEEMIVYRAVWEAMVNVPRLSGLNVGGLRVAVFSVVVVFFEFDQEAVKLRSYDPGNRRNLNWAGGYLARR